MENNNTANLIENEIEILSLINHPNIIKLYEVFEITNKKKKKFTVIILEYCDNGCLLDYLNNYMIDEEDKKTIAFGLINALKYLHEYGIAHCDIKLENVLLDKNLEPKLCDFGFSKNLNATFDDAKRGSLDYAAPELFKPGDVNFIKSDIWALGVSLYALYEKKFPFKSFQDVLNGNLSIRAKNESINEIVNKCIDYDPLNRADATDLLNHDYFYE